MAGVDFTHPEEAAAYAESAADPADIPTPDALDSSIAPDDLEPASGRLGNQRLCCPHPQCPWWVPEGREHLADAHACVGPVYDAVDRSAIVATDAETTPAAYVDHFIDDGGYLDFDALATDALERPRSERIRLLFGFHAFGYQRAALDDPNADVSINCGRQVGKTEIGGAIGADAVLFAAIPTDDDIAFFGDVQDTAMDMFRRCKRHLKNCPIPLSQLGVNRDNETFWEFLDDSTRIITGSLNLGGDNERGKLPKVVVVDEAALCQRSSFDRVVKPMFMTHGDDHELYALSTPRGETGYHYDAHQPGREPDYFSVHAVPAWANPKVSESWLAKERANTDSDTWRQEYLGEFIPEGNAYIPTSIYRPCQTDLEIAPGARDRGYLRVAGHPKPGHEYYLGVDVAGGGDDRTVYLVLTDDGTTVHVENEQTSKQPAILGRVGALHDEFDFVSGCIDENAIGTGVTDFAAEDPALAGVMHGVTFSTPQKSQMYKTLKKAFEAEALTLPKHGRLERETTKLRYEFTSNRHVKVSHPENGHDDHPDALGLANWAREGVEETDERTERRTGREKRGRRTVTR